MIIMRLYELALVLRPSLSDKERTKVVDGIKSTLSDIAKVTKEDDLGQKPLSYKIEKETAGYYYIMQLESETGIKPDFEKSLYGQDTILRHLLIRKK